MTRESERTVAAVEAALTLLDAFGGSEPLRLADLHDQTGLTRSRIMRLLGTLEICGYVVPAGRGQYALGPKAFRLGWSVRESYSSMLAVVQPSLKRAVEATGATAFFSIPRGRERVAIAKEAPPVGVRYVIEEGQIRPLYVGATGRVMMAHLPDALNEEVLASPLHALTDSTVVNPDVLRAQIAEARAQGFAVSLGEATSTAYAVAVPIVSGRRLVGALSLAGPISDFDDRQEICLRTLLEEADFLSKRIA